MTSIGVFCKFLVAELGAEPEVIVVRERCRACFGALSVPIDLGLDLDLAMDIDGVGGSSSSDITMISASGGIVFVLGGWRMV